MGNTGFDLAQSTHDRTEPPEEPYCRTCDNSGVVSVPVYSDTGGDRWEIMEHEQPSIPCLDCRFDDLKIMEAAFPLLMALEDLLKGPPLEGLTGQRIDNASAAVDKARGVYHEPTPPAD